MWNVINKMELSFSRDTKAFSPQNSFDPSNNSTYCTNITGRKDDQLAIIPIQNAKNLQANQL